MQTPAGAVTPIDEGAIIRDDLIAMRAVIHGEHELHRDAPIVVKTTAMSWEDLALATAIMHRLG